MTAGAAPSDRLTLAVPVWNDAANLRRLLAEAAWLGGVDRVLVVDDASDPPVTEAGITPRAWRGQDRIRVLRQPAQAGAGPARNRALAETETGLLLYADSDDRLTPELPHLLRDLAGQSFDFCLFKHNDSRVSAEGGWGQPDWDEALWRRAGLAVGALSAAGPDQCALLAQTANYPWNKIYRTAFLRDHGIGCAAILLHEDVELHWRSFLAARRVLVSDRVVAIHHVAAGGGRLTNRTGAERLAVFASLVQIAGLIGRDPAGAGLVLPFLRFVCGLFDWIPGHLAPALQADFARGRAACLADLLALPAFAAGLAAASDPALAHQIARQRAAPGPA